MRRGRPSRPLLFVHPGEALREAGVAAGEARERALGKPRLPLCERSHLGVGRRHAGVALGLHLRRELGPLPLDRADLLVAQLLAPAFERLELVGRVVPLVHRDPSMTSVSSAIDG